MLASSSSATRLLAAAALLNEQGVRRTILGWLEDPNRGVPPERGLDLSLVARVAAYADGRERRYNILFAALALTTAVFLIAGLSALTALVLIGAAGLWFRKKRQERDWLKQYFTPDTYSADEVERHFTSGPHALATDALPDDDADLTVYKGFSPFVGAGTDIGGWSFVIATDKAKTDFLSGAVTTFQSSELYDAVTNSLNRLQLPSLEQRDHYFIEGTDVAQEGALLYSRYGRPQQKATEELRRRGISGVDPRVRHYRWISVSDWGADISVSFFLRCCQRGPTLFVELKRFLLTPLHSKLRRIDDLVAADDLQDIVGTAIAAAIAAPIKLIAAPFSCYAYMAEVWESATKQKERHRREMIDQSARWNYGAPTSIRHTFASNEYVRYFQRADSDYFQKTLESEILDALILFLDAHGVDTSDLRDRQSTILNHGVIVHGGNVEAGSLAVGDGARAVHNTVSKVIRTAKRRTEGMS